MALPAARSTVSNACISTPAMVSIACAAGRQATPYREAVVRAPREAEAIPVVRPLGRLATRRARPTERHETTDGTVVVPEGVGRVRRWRV